VRKKVVENRRGMEKRELRRRGGIHTNR